MNIFHITLGYESTGDRLFSPKNKSLWEKMRRSAIGKGAFLLKQKIRKQFESDMPGASRPLRSKSPSGKRWKGKLSDAVQQGKVDLYEYYGETDVHIKGVRTSGSGSFIGLFYNEGVDNGRYGQKMVRSKTDRKKKEENKNYHYRGNLPGYHYLKKGSQGFQFTTTVDEIIKRYINEIV